jgi:hypothetical protein
MAVPFLRRSSFLRSLVVTTFFFSFLAWVYVVLRVVVNKVDPPSPFVPGIRFPTFFDVGAFAFGLSFLSLLVYLWLWSPFARAVGAPPAWQDRRP